MLRRRGPGSAVWHAVAADGGDRAVKLVELERATRPEVAALERERDALSTVTHPAICRALDWIEAGNVRALVLEHLPGGDLVSLAGGPPAHWLGALADVAAALGCLHGRGFAHRDVKSRNVRFDAADHARLIDFGSCEPLGSRWRTGGTTAEHRKPGWAGRAHGPGDDAYAFAALCHEMLHGRPPTVPGRPRPVDDAPELARLVERTLGMAPDDCDGSLDEFSAVIKWLLDKNAVRLR